MHRALGFTPPVNRVFHLVPLYSWVSERFVELRRPPKSTVTLRSES
jgi:hypothetical protein